MNDDSALKKAIPFGVEFEVAVDELAISNSNTNTYSMGDDDTGTYNSGTEDSDT